MPATNSTARVCAESIHIVKILDTFGAPHWEDEDRIKQLQSAGVENITITLLIPKIKQEAEWLYLEVAARRLADETGTTMTAARKRISRAAASGKIRTTEVGMKTMFDAGDVSKFAQGWAGS